MKTKIHVPQQVPGCPSYLPTSCVQMFLLGWGKGTVTEEPAFLHGKGKEWCVSILGWPPHTNQLELNSGSSVWLLASPSVAGSPGLTSGISIVMAHKDTALPSLWLKQNVNSNILVILFLLHRHTAHHTLTLGRTLALWGLLRYPPVYLGLAHDTDI